MDTEKDKKPKKGIACVANYHQLLQEEPTPLRYVCMASDNCAHSLINELRLHVTPIRWEIVNL